MAREAARVKFLDQLDAELDQVEDRSHPLLDIAYQRLREEKADRLERLRRYQDEREKELELMLDKRLQASWRQWAVRVPLLAPFFGRRVDCLSKRSQDQKDALRMKLYLENHTSLKELVAEEKVFPFFRDHPLFVNNHDLPPTSYYRGPQRDPAFQPREILHAGHYVEPPPLNPALTHESWQLAPEEIEADLALFYDIEDEPFYAPPPPAPVPSAPSVGMFPYAHPPFYYDPLAAPPPGARLTSQPRATARRRRRSLRPARRTASRPTTPLLLRRLLLSAAPSLRPVSRRHTRRTLRPATRTTDRRLRASRLNRRRRPCLHLHASRPLHPPYSIRRVRPSSSQPLRRHLCSPRSRRRCPRRPHQHRQRTSSRRQQSMAAVLAPRLCHQCRCSDRPRQPRRGPRR